MHNLDVPQALGKAVRSQKPQGSQKTREAIVYRPGKPKTGMWLVSDHIALGGRKLASLQQQSL